MMKKRTLASILAVSMLMGLFSGCGADGKAVKVKLDSKNPVTVDIWHYYNGAQKMAFDRLVAEFNETVGMEQGIIVEAFNQGDVTQLTESIVASANNKVGTDPVPNIFAAYADTAYQIDKMGLVADLNTYLTEEDLKGYIPSYLEEGKLGEGDMLKIFPTAKSTEILMLNKTDWEPFSAAAGVGLESLATVEGLIEVSEAYYNWTDAQTPDVLEDGKAFFGRDAMANYFIIGCKQLGTEIFSVKDGKVTFQVQEDVMKTLWDNYYVPYINGYFTAEGRFRSDDAKEGNLLALVGSTSSATYFPTEVRTDDGGYPIEALVMAAPSFQNGTPVSVQQGAGMVVTKSTPQEEYASTVFLKWFTEPERNLSFSILSGYLPVKTEANDIEILNTAVENSDVSQWSDVLKQTFTVAIDVVKTQELYTNRAFEGGTDARAVLENSMQELAAADREAVKALIAEGTSREDAVAQYDTQEHFNAWLAGFQEDLAATQKG